jgi:hypothetical protein
LLTGREKTECQLGAKGHELGASRDFGNWNNIKIGRINKMLTQVKNKIKSFSEHLSPARLFPVRRGNGNS